ncbi:phosphocholine cytidylyltransferase family protein [Candidatus Woesearchaeota archaeon]|nr:phosphocholine cytidylyltransferase family protein [Candidatus Woesearchaeota archaeon]
MKAIILAAGVGSRLGDVTKTTPKCLIKIGSKVIAEHQIEALTSNNLTDISMVIGHQAEKVKDALKDKNVKFYTNKDYDKTGMLESLFCAEKELNGDVIMLYGDIVFKENLIRKLLKDKNDICLVVDRYKEIAHESEKAFEEYHGQKLEKGSTKVNIVDGIVKKISKSMPKEEASAEYIGITKFSRKIVEIVHNRIKELIDNGEIKAYPTPSRLFKWLIENGHEMHVTYTDGILYEEIDYADDLESAKEKFV